jgi:type VI secretion system protein ImpA
MASPEVLDFDRMLAPISGDNPAGADLRADPAPMSDYQTIRMARTAARDVEKRLDHGDDAGMPDWKSVVLERGKAVVAGKSKDMEITAYLIEALVRLHGLPGLRDGFRLARELVERFWEGLYPDPADTDYESRFSHILQLSGIDGPGTLIVPVRKIRFTKRSGGDADYSPADHMMALRLSQLGDVKVRERKTAEGAVTLDMIQQAVASTPAPFYAALTDDLAEARREFLGFAAALAGKSGYDPPMSDLLGALESFHDVVADLARDKLPKEAPKPAEPVPGAADGGAAAATAPRDPTALLTRSDALEQLSRVAAYFREHEPQSIIPFALEQVITWGKMPLPDLLAELIPDDGPRKNLFKQVGIK